MEMVTREVRTMMVAVECECGGMFTEPWSDEVFYTIPIQKAFKCNRCDNIERLPEPCFPKLVYV